MRYDSIKIIGSVKERFGDLVHKEWDWKSFYNGWLEGRSDMLAEILKIGKYGKR